MAIHCVYHQACAIEFPLNLDQGGMGGHILALLGRSFSIAESLPHAISPLPFPLPLLSLSLSTISLQKMAWDGVSSISPVFVRNTHTPLITSGTSLAELAQSNLEERYPLSVARPMEALSRESPYPCHICMRSVLTPRLLPLPLWRRCKLRSKVIALLWCKSTLRRLAPRDLANLDPKAQNWKESIEKSLALRLSLRLFAHTLGPRSPRALRRLWASSSSSRLGWSQRLDLAT